MATVQDVGIQKADKHMIAADKKAEKFDWFGISKQQNQEDAAGLYNAAAAQYIAFWQYGKAGLCCSKAAKCYMAAQNDSKAITSWQAAGIWYRKAPDSTKLAIEAYKHAIQLNLDADRFRQAAILQAEIAEMLAEDDHFDEAIKAYEQCADYYQAGNDTRGKNEQLLKVAHMSGEAKKWAKAIKIFEDIAKASVDDYALQWKVKEYLFKAMLCQICLLGEQDVDKKKDIKWPVAGTTINERYCEISDIYASSAECKLVVQILDCLPTQKEQFKDAVASYDRITKLEKWSSQLVYEIEGYMTKKQHEAPDLENEIEGGFDDDDEQKTDDTPQQHQQPKTNPFDNQLNNNDLQDAPDLDGDLL